MKYSARISLRAIAILAVCTAAAVQLHLTLDSTSSIERHMPRLAKHARDSIARDIALRCGAAQHCVLYNNTTKTAPYIVASAALTCNRCAALLCITCLLPHQHNNCSVRPSLCRSSNHNLHNIQSAISFKPPLPHPAPALAHHNPISDTKDLLPQDGRPSKKRRVCCAAGSACRNIDTAGNIPLLQSTTPGVTLVAGKFRCSACTVRRS